jgi:hypothetical protein
VAAVEQVVGDVAIAAEIVRALVEAVSHSTSSPIGDRSDGAKVRENKEKVNSEHDGYK